MKDALKDWTKETKETLDAEVKKLISQANFDLYYGPSGGGLDDEDEDGTPAYPGFETACREIRRALSDLPSTVYVDEDSGCWTTTEPSCWTCGGCEECDGEDLCVLEPGPYVVYERKDLIRAIVGRELAEYVS